MEYGTEILDEYLHKIANAPRHVPYNPKAGDKYERGIISYLEREGYVDVSPGNLMLSRLTDRGRRLLQDGGLTALRQAQDQVAKQKERTKRKNDRGYSILSLTISAIIGAAATLFFQWLFF